MTKKELDSKARAILESPHPRSRRNNMILASTDDLSRILDIESLREVQKRFGMWDTYTIEVVEELPGYGYMLRFHDGQEVKMRWI